MRNDLICNTAGVAPDARGVERDRTVKSLRLVGRRLISSLCLSAFVETSFAVSAGPTLARSQSRNLCVNGVDDSLCTWTVD